MAGVTIQVIDHVSPMLRGVVRSIKDLKPALQTAGLYMYRETVRQFQTSGARAGTPWTPLKPSTIRRRRKKSSAILQDTRRLMRSVTARIDPNAIYDLTDTSLTLGTNLEYAAIHQYGGDIGRTVKAGSVRLRTKRNGQVRFAKASYKGRTRTVNYAGGKTYNIHIPARPFLVVTDDDEKAIANIFLRHALKGRRSA